ncbi:MAG: monofunctional biosynthetic peptidoglycan transglycosylase [bacterium]|nr:monofunctional biosynthetic peptidoglycan transglycosylase [bacterium]
MLKRLLFWLLIAFGLLLLYIVAPALLINPGKLKTQRPGQTALMKLRIEAAAQKGRVLKIDQRWVPLSRISNKLKEAVRVSEDAAFFSHGGIDWDEAKEAMNYNLKKRRFARGASTITMQLARNLYLSPSKNPLRKLQEILITYRLELSLSKSRILELYLNIVEWGDGIFGAEAAAQKYFHTTANDLTTEEAARLAAVLPSPLHWNPASERVIVLRRKNLILKRMGGNDKGR